MAASIFPKNGLILFDMLYVCFRTTILIGILTDQLIVLMEATSIQGASNEALMCTSGVDGCVGVPIKMMCGTNGVTYKNACDFFRARTCYKHEATINYNGPCVVKERRCQKTRKLNLQNGGNNNMYDRTYIPNCKKNGLFQNKQCQRNGEVCFCVRKKSGAIIEGTFVKKPNIPICRGSCSAKKLNKFNSNLNAEFDRQFNYVISNAMKTLPKNRGSHKQALPIKGEAMDITFNSTERQVAEWKLSDLDSNHDNALDYSEFRTVFSPSKQQSSIRSGSTWPPFKGGPRACRKGMFQRCDSDENGRVERDEWVICLGLVKPTTARNGASNEPIVNKRMADQVQIGLPITPTEDGSILQLIARKPLEMPTSNSRQKISCPQARRDSEKKNAQSSDDNKTIFVPQCTSKGKYRRKQCHKLKQGKELCFCADPKTGEVIKTGRSSSGRLDCRHMRQKNRECTEHQKQIFNENLISWFSNELKKSDIRKNSGPPSFAHLNQQNIRFAFNQYDLDKSQILEKKELVQFKRSIRQFIRKVAGSARLSTLKGCLNNVIRFCDANANNQITWNEIDKCVAQGFGMLPRKQ